MFGTLAAHPYAEIPVLVGEWKETFGIGICRSIGVYRRMCLPLVSKVLAKQALQASTSSSLIHLLLFQIFKKIKPHIHPVPVRICNSPCVHRYA